MTIITKYLGASNTRGSRIKASALGQSVSIPYPHELSPTMAHRKAASLLMSRFTSLCDREWVQGETKSGYVFTPVVETFKVPA